MQLHSKNLDFRWRDAEPPTSPSLPPDWIAQYNRQGAFHYANAFTATEVDSVIAALDPLAAAANAQLRDQPKSQPSIAREDEIVFSAHLVADSPKLSAFAKHPVLMDICRALLGADVNLYWDQLVYKNPNTQDEFPWHQDNGYTFVEPQQYLTCWIALTDATVDNGCPWIVPGLHRQGTLRHRWTDLGFECLQQPVDAQPIELAAGSIAVFSSLTPHRTGPNITADTRKSYILQYAPAGAKMFPYLSEPVMADNPDWQFPVLVNSEVV